MSTSTSAMTRPRVTGERETEILEAVIAVLRDHGYDRLTFDAVAAAAQASKATLYRRWPHKRDLVLDAISLLLDCPADRDPDTGSLRGDLLAQACADGGVADEEIVGVWGALLPVIHRDPELLTAIQQRLVAPKMAAVRQIFVNAQERGEVGPDADLDTLLMVLPALSMHESMLTGRRLEPERVAQIVDNVVLPACAATLASPR